jgi:transposase-like protein
MAQTRKMHPQEFKRRLVELVRTGRSPEELARELVGVYTGVICRRRRSWRKRG